MRNPKFIRISSNGLCDEVFKELSFTGNPHNVFQATIYFTWKLLEDYLPYAFLCLSKCGKGRVIFYFRMLLRFPQLFVGVANKFFFYIPFLTCFLTFHSTSAYSLVPFDLNFSLCHCGFLLSFAWHGLLGIVFFLSFSSREFQSVFLALFIGVFYPDPSTG